MSIISILLLAIALSIDACVVAFAHGLVLEKHRLKNSLLLGLFTGVFQAIMPLIGYYATTPFYKFIAPIGKWVVFAIFLYLGLKVIKEAFEENREIPSCLSIQCLFMIAIATSIDALAAGITLALTSVNIFKSVFLIGSTTFLFAFVGYWSGCFLKKLSTKGLEIFAGVILIFLAVKSLF